MITGVDNPSTVWQDADQHPDRSTEGATLPLLEDAYRVKDPDKLRAKLKSERWSYRLLARQLGVSKDAIGKYVTGKRRIPPARALKIAEVVNFNPADFFVHEVSTTVGSHANDERQLGEQVEGVGG
jgi:hypothetical protein